MIQRPPRRDMARAWTEIKILVAGADGRNGRKLRVRGKPRTYKSGEQASRAALEDVMVLDR